MPGAASQIHRIYETIAKDMTMYAKKNLRKNTLNFLVLGNRLTRISPASFKQRKYVPKRIKKRVSSFAH